RGSHIRSARFLKRFKNLAGRKTPLSSLFYSLSTSNLSLENIRKFNGLTLKHSLNIFRSMLTRRQLRVVEKHKLTHKIFTNLLFSLSNIFLHKTLCRKEIHRIGIIRTLFILLHFLNQALITFSGEFQFKSDSEFMSLLFKIKDGIRDNFIGKLKVPLIMNLVLKLHIIYPTINEKRSCNL